MGPSEFPRHITGITRHITYTPRNNNSDANNGTYSTYSWSLNAHQAHVRVSRPRNKPGRGSINMTLVFMAISTRLQLQLQVSAMEEHTTAVLLSRKGVTMQFSCRSATTTKMVWGCSALNSPCRCFFFCQYQ